MSKVSLEFDTYIDQKTPEVFIGLSIKVKGKETMVVEVGQDLAHVLLEQLTKSINTIEEMSNPDNGVIH